MTHQCLDTRYLIKYVRRLVYQMIIPKKEYFNGSVVMIWHGTKSLLEFRLKLLKIGTINPIIPAAT